MMPSALTNELTTPAPRLSGTATVLPFTSPRRGAHELAVLERRVQAARDHGLRIFNLCVRAAGKLFQYRLEDVLQYQNAGDGITGHAQYRHQAGLG